jgi:hypothetical protein
MTRNPYFKKLPLDESLFHQFNQVKLSCPEKLKAMFLDQGRDFPDRR